MMIIQLLRAQTMGGVMFFVMAFEGWLDHCQSAERDTSITAQQKHHADLAKAKACVSCRY